MEVSIACVINKGIAAISRSTIVVGTKDKRLFTGTADDQDITISALKALIHAVNQAYIEAHYKVERERVAA